MRDFETEMDMLYIKCQESEASLVNNPSMEKMFKDPTEAVLVIEVFMSDRLLSPDGEMNLPNIALRQIARVPDLLEDVDAAQITKDPAVAIDAFKMLRADVRMQAYQEHPEVELDSVEHHMHMAEVLLKEYPNVLGDVEEQSLTTQTAGKSYTDVVKVLDVEGNDLSAALLDFSEDVHALDTLEAEVLEQEQRLEMEEHTL